MATYKGVSPERFTPYLSDNPRETRQAAEILAAHMRGSLAAASKRLQRFLQRTDPRLVLWRRLPDDAPLVIGDITEIPRPQTCKTSYGAP